MPNQRAPAELKKQIERGPNMAAQSEWLELLGKATNYNLWIFRAIAPYLSGNALEIGCGIGNFSPLIAGRVKHLTAVDISDSFIDTARKRLSEIPNMELVHGDAADIPIGKKFDTIILLDVLEHIADDARLLNLLSRKLASGGHLVLKLPAAPRLYNSLDIAVGHYRRYDKNSLIKVAGLSGFDVSHCRAFNIAGIPGWWWNGIRKREIAPDIQIGGFDRLVPLLEFAEKLITPSVGLSLIGVLKLTV